GLGRVVGAGAIGQGPASAAPLLVLSVPVFPAQLLAEPGAELAVTVQPALPAGAGVHGVPRLQAAALALGVFRAAVLLPRLPLLAGSVLTGVVLGWSLV